MTTLALQLEDNPFIATGLLIVGIVFISAWLLMRIRKRSLRGPGHPTAQEHLERYKQKDAVRNDMESLMVDIEQLAKRLGAQLDAKTIHLEKLLDDADLRIAQLQQAMHAQHRPPEASTPLSGESSASSETDTPAVGSTSSPAAPPDGAADPLATDVYRLADEGHAPPEIARRLEEHVGKVELILALRQA